MKKLLTKQIVKSGVVGALNTGIDFIVFNCLISIFELEQTENYKFVIFKSIAFLAAVTNSFALNKLWVFRNREAHMQSVRKQAASFFAISLLGFLLNVTMSYIVFSLGYKLTAGTSVAMSTQGLANIGAIVGAVTVFVFNFLGYKKLVFIRGPKQRATPEDIAGKDAGASAAIALSARDEDEHVANATHAADAMRSENNHIDKTAPLSNLAKLRRHIMHKHTYGNQFKHQAHGKHA